MTPTYPRIDPDRDRKHRYYLCEDTTIVLSNGDTLTIHEGYRFDGHSIPRIFWLMFPSFDCDVYAALVHDYLLDTEMLHRYDRKFIDSQYEFFMNKPEYLATKTRRYVFPKVVKTYGKIVSLFSGMNL